MKRFRRKMKKGMAMFLASLMLVGLLQVMPESALVAQAAEGNAPSVTSFATKDELMTTFTPNADGTATTIGKVVFGKDSSGNPLEWYILGEDSGITGDNIAIFTTSPIATGQQFENDYISKKTFAESFGTYAANPEEVYPSHYGASDLRVALQGLATNASYFTTKEQSLMQATTVTTKDILNSVDYTTKDVLYTVMGDNNNNKLCLGSNNEKVLLMSTYWNSGDRFWLRAPHVSFSYCALIADPGSYVSSRNVDINYAVRPASNLNLSSVIFASAATAATSDTAVAGSIAEGTAMTLRLDGIISGGDGTTDIGEVLYDADKNLILAKKDASAGTVALVVQGNDGTNDWYYSKTISGTEWISTETIQTALSGNSVSVESISLSDCKIWLETTDTDANLIYATMAEAGTFIDNVAITEIDTPAGGTAFDTSATSATEGLVALDLTVAWTKGGEAAGETADYGTTYTASITLTPEEKAAFVSGVTATVDGNEATVTPNTDGTVTVTYDFTTAKIVTISGEDVTITYDGSDTLNVSDYFTIDTNAGAPTYEMLASSTGTGSLSGSALTMNTLGTFVIRVSTPINGVYEAGEHTLTITINKATPEVTALPTVSDSAYHPAAVLADTDITGGTVEGVAGNSISGTWSWKEAGIVATVGNDGYIAVFTPEDTIHYNTIEKTIPVNVSKATPYIQTAPGAADITYGAALGSSQLSNGVVHYGETDNTVVAGSFDWKDADIKPAVSDSNSTTYTVVFTPADTANYNTVETEIKLTVNKAQNAPNMPGSTMNVPYSNKTVGAVTLPEGWAWQDADKNVALEVGVTTTATADYVGADKGNYENETVEITITRSECEHTNTEVRNAKDATCEQTGYTGDTYCKDCGVKLASGTATAASGHNYTSEATKEPTTTEEGIMTYTCSKCGHTYTQAIEKLPEDKPGNDADDDRPNDKPESDNEPDDKPDTEKPFIKDEHGKEGWDVIRGEVEDAKDGDTVTVDMNGATIVPGDVFDDIKGRDITIVFDMGNGITWSVNGQDITSDNVGDIDFSVKVGTEENPINTIPVEVINKVTGERYFINISLAYDGEFGFTAVLSLNMDAENAGLFANLFYFNEQTEELEFICADEIAPDGTAELTFTHASEYTIVIDANTMETPDTDDTPGNPETDDTPDDPEADNTPDKPETDGTQDVPKAPQTGYTTDDIWRSWWIVLFWGVIMVIGSGVFLVMKKKGNAEG